MGMIADEFRRAAATSAREANDDDYVTLESRRDPDRWIQITADAINVAYPWDAEPTRELRRRGFTFPESVVLMTWEAGKYATFEHRGEPFDELVAFVERYAREVLEVEPDESGFTVSREP